MRLGRHGARPASYEAMLERDLERLAQRLEAEAQPLAFICLTTELMVVYDKFLVQLAAMSDYNAKKNRDRMARALAGPLASAQSNGLLRPDLTSSDVLTICRMLASNWRLDAQASFEHAFGRHLGLIMRGLQPPP